METVYVIIIKYHECIQNFPTLSGRFRNNEHVEADFVFKS